MLGRLTERATPRTKCSATTTQCRKLRGVHSCGAPPQHPSTGSRAQRLAPGARPALPSPASAFASPNAPYTKLTPSLQEWLSHSRQRHCEICGHAYTFTKGESRTRTRMLRDARCTAPAMRGADMKRNVWCSVHVKRLLFQAVGALRKADMQFTLPPYRLRSPSSSMFVSRFSSGAASAGAFSAPASLSFRGSSCSPS